MKSPRSQENTGEICVKSYITSRNSKANVKVRLKQVHMVITCMNYRERLPLSEAEAILATLTSKAEREIAARTPCASGIFTTSAFIFLLSTGCWSTMTYKVASPVALCFNPKRTGTKYSPSTYPPRFSGLFHFFYFLKF